MILPQQFREFLQNISLGDQQERRIQSATRVLKEYLMQEAGISVNHVFLQGSYPCGTCIRPSPSAEDGEYDVDMVCLMANNESRPPVAKAHLFQILSKNGNYRDRIEHGRDGKPCIRLRYADDYIGKFHVDIVPGRIANGDTPIEIPKDGQWHGTAPQEFTQWIIDRGEKYCRISKYFKRWRDEQQAVHSGIRSVVLQVLVARFLGTSSLDDECMVQTLEAMELDLSGLSEVPKIYNPVLEPEDLAASWQISHFNEFKECLSEAAAFARQAFDENDERSSIELWATLFGESFPSYAKERLTPEDSEQKLGDIRHTEPIRWLFQSTQRFNLTTKVQYTLSKRISTRKPPYFREKGLPVKRRISSGMLVPKNAKIFYRAEFITVPGDEIWWQVVNTGSDAMQQRGLRGQIFQNSDAVNPMIREESTKYIGTHWIECFIVRNGYLVAQSGRFYITIL